MAQQNQGKSAEQLATAKATEEKRVADLAIEADLKAALENVEVSGKSDDFNDLSHTEIANVIADAVEKAMDARVTQASDTVGLRIDETDGTIKKLYTMIGQMQASQQLSDLRGGNKDFDTYREDTVAVLKKYPMMEIVDAFALAKSQRKGDVPPAEEIETERPGPGAMNFNDDGSMVRRPPTRELKKAEGELKPGIVNFREIVKAGVEAAIKNKR